MPAAYVFNVGKTAHIERTLSRDTCTWHAVLRASHSEHNITPPSHSGCNGDADYHHGVWD